MTRLLNIRPLICLTVISLFLSACGGGGGAGNTGGTTNTQTTDNSTTKNVAPTITGTPTTIINSGENYIFTPIANDSDGDKLVFSVKNLPAWASFSTSTGAITGIPGSNDTGSYNNISISVSDNTATTTLASFNIDVLNTNTANNSKSAKITWNIPSTYDDGSDMNISDIGGYRIYSGKSADKLNLVADINSSQQTSYTFENLADGIHYVSISIYDINGVESKLSAPLSFTI